MAQTDTSVNHPQLNELLLFLMFLTAHFSSASSCIRLRKQYIHNRTGRHPPPQRPSCVVKGLSQLVSSMLLVCRKETGTRKPLYARWY